MPRSTTAWLMASVSVAFSAIRPIHINNRLIALNIGLLSVVWCLLLLHRLFLFEENLALENILQLRVELLLIGCPDDRRAELLDRIKDFGIHIKRHEVHGHAHVLLIRLLFEFGHDRSGRRP